MEALIIFLICFSASSLLLARTEVAAQSAGLEYDENCYNVLGDTVCHRYKKTGECIRLRYKMVKYCRRSCGLCASGNGDRWKSRAQSSGCLNERGDIYCEYWAKRDKCGSNEEMRLDCQKACGLCGGVKKSKSFRFFYSLITILSI